MTPLPARIWAGLALVALAVSGCSGSSATGRSSSASPASSPPTSTAALVAPRPSPPRSTPAPRPVPTPRVRTPAPPPPTTRPPAPAGAVKPPPGQALPLAFSTGSATQVITCARFVDPFDDRDVAGVESSPGRRLAVLRCGRLCARRVRRADDHAQREHSATPIGSFGLTQAFGRAANPGTALPYFVAGPQDWWVSDASSPYYNTHQTCGAACPFNTAAGENLYQAGYVYTYAVVIDYNRFPVRAPEPVARSSSTSATEVRRPAASRSPGDARLALVVAQSVSPPAHADRCRLIVDYVLQSPPVPAPRARTGRRAQRGDAPRSPTWRRPRRTR